MKEAYYFGNLVRQVDLFAYPRTGSHFFIYAMSGLYDLIALSHSELHNPEAIARQSELREEILYALSLRDDGVPYTPVYFDALKNGIHGKPVKGENPMVVLIRDPLATVYSLFRASRDRWKTITTLTPEWIEKALRDYLEFYRPIISEEALPDTLLVRYEQLVESPAPLESVAQLVGVKPKLNPKFVHWLLRFENVVKPGERTFYRSGRNDVWREDEQWVSALKRIPNIDFTPAGYPTLQRYLAQAQPTNTNR